MVVGGCPGYTQKDPEEMVTLLDSVVPGQQADQDSLAQVEADLEEKDTAENLQLASAQCLFLWGERMKIELNIKKVCINRVTGGADHVMLITEKPYPFPALDPEGDENLALIFEVVAGKGEEYLEEHFGIPKEAIKVIG